MRLLHNLSINIKEHVIVFSLRFGLTTWVKVMSQTTAPGLVYKPSVDSLRVNLS
jgi:hypothetical protein